MTEHLTVHADALTIDLIYDSGSTSQVVLERNPELFLAVKAIPDQHTAGNQERGTVMLPLDVDGEGAERVFVDTAGATDLEGNRRPGAGALGAASLALNRLRTGS